ILYSAWAFTVQLINEIWIRTPRERTCLPPWGQAKFRILMSSPAYGIQKDFIRCGTEALPIQFFLLRFGLSCFFCYPSCSSKLRIRSFSCWVGLQFSYIIQVIYSMRGERDTWSHFQI